MTRFGLTFAIFSVALHGTTLHAEIIGFDNLSGWTYKQGDTGAPATVGEDFIELTNGGNQRRNVWFNTGQDIGEFTASFSYRVFSSALSPSGMGLSFIIQNDPDGVDALTDSAFGYGFAGIQSSAGVTLELDGSRGKTFTSFYRNGIVGSGAANVAPHSPVGNGFDVNIDYNGSLLKVVVDDGFNMPFVRNYVIAPSLSDALGSGNAVVGFGASTAGSSGITQIISNFRFSSASAVPEPSSAMLSPIAITLVCLRRRRKHQQ